MLRRTTPARFSSAFVAAMDRAAACPSKKSTMSAAASSTTARHVNKSRQAAPPFYPYCDTSAERFHWKSAAKELLGNLSAQQLAPTAAVSTGWMGDHQELEKQFHLEQKSMKKVLDDPAHYSFQADAAADVENYIANHHTEFTDLLKFRVRHGVALPAEIRWGQVCGLLSDDDVHDKEASELARALAPDMACGGSVGGIPGVNAVVSAAAAFFGASRSDTAALPLIGDMTHVATALLHASGIEFCGGRSPADWCAVFDHVPLGCAPTTDRTSAKITSCCFSTNEFDPRPRFVPSHESSSAWFSPERLKHVEWDKATVYVVRLASLDRTAFRQQGQSDWTGYDSFINPATARLEKDQLFGASSKAEPDATRRHRLKMLTCVPRISSFAANTQSLISYDAVRQLHERVAGDKNAVVLFQDCFSQFSPGLPNMVGVTPAPPADMHLVEHVLLRSLPIAGFTRLSGWRGPADWIENVVRRECGFGDGDDGATIRVATVRDTVGVDSTDGWMLEPSMADLAEKGMAAQSRLPRCAFESTAWGNLNLVRDLKSELSLGFYDQGDLSAFSSVVRDKEVADSFWRGCPMPTRVAEWAKFSPEHWRSV